MSIIVLGTVALDTVKTPFGVKKDMLGGSAVHFSMAARLFTPVHLLAVVGKDFPKKHLDFLKQKNVILTSLVQTEGITFKWHGKYEGDLNSANTIKTELGVLSTFKPVISQAQKGIKNIFLANIDPDIQRDLLKHMRSPDLIALDSMNYWISQKRSALLKVLKKINIYVANDQEARDLSGESNLIKAGKRLSSFGPQMVLIKKGEHGVLFFYDDFIFSLPAFPVAKVIDPTGAGDTFAGGFMGYLAAARKGDASTIKKALAYGTVAASFNVEGFGINRTASLTMQGLNRRLAQFRKCVLF